MIMYYDNSPLPSDFKELLNSELLKKLDSDLNFDITNVNTTNPILNETQLIDFCLLELSNEIKSPDIEATFVDTVIYQITPNDGLPIYRTFLL